MIDIVVPVQPTCILRDLVSPSGLRVAYYWENYIQFDTWGKPLRYIAFSFSITVRVHLVQATNGSNVTFLVAEIAFCLSETTS